MTFRNFRKTTMTQSWEDGAIKSFDVMQETKNGDYSSLINPYRVFQGEFFDIPQIP